MRYLISFFAFVIVASLLNACNAPLWLQEQMNNPHQPSDTAVVDQQLIDYGVTVYLEQYCGVCHTLEAANTRGTFGPDHSSMGSIALERVSELNYNGEATTAEAYIRESLLAPQIYYAPGYEATNHHMPTYTHLPEEQIEAMVYMLVHQGVSNP